MINWEAKVVGDTATPNVEALKAKLTLVRIQRAVGTECVRLTQDHLNRLGPNKRGWPSTEFYKGAAAGTTWDRTEEGIVVAIDNEEHPRAMRQRYYGGKIRMKDKLLAIPARQEFAASSPTEFTNLRFVQFHSGAKALVVGTGGVGRINSKTGNERAVKGAGARAAAVVAFWLKEEVDQKGDKSVVPSGEQYIQTAKDAVVALVAGKGGAA